MLFERGRAAYERELFTQAEDAFQAAYEAMPADHPGRPLILLNVAQAIDRQGGRDEDALEVWRRFETEAGEAADADAAARARARIRELDARIRRRERGQEREPVGAEPTATEPAETEPSGFSPHWSGILLTGVGGAAIVAGAIVGIVGLAERGSVLDMCSGTTCAPEARDSADRLDDLALAADLLLWPGLAVAAVGTVLMFTIADADTNASMAVTCGPGGCVLRGTF